MDNLYDGISADPMEVMFVKVKEFLIRDETASALGALKYTAWSNTSHDDNKHRVNGVFIHLVH